jgi:hypothetical protein
VARIAGQRPMTRQVFCGGTSVGSGSERAVHFGLGRATHVDRLEITWPASRRRTVLRGVAVDRLVTVREPAS